MNLQKSTANLSIRTHRLKAWHETPCSLRRSALRFLFTQPVPEAPILQNLIHFFSFSFYFFLTPHPSLYFPLYSHQFYPANARSTTFAKSNLLLFFFSIYPSGARCTNFAKFDLLFFLPPGWQKLCEGTKGLPRKVWTENSE